MGRSRKPLKRTIQFYVTSLLHPGTRKGIKPQAHAFREIARLPMANSEGQRGRYLMYEDYDECLDLVEKKDGSFDGRLHRTRRTDPPMIGSIYTERLVEFESDDEGIRFPTHFTWWDLSHKPEKLGLSRAPCGLLGMEFNPQGPRHSTLEEYINSFGDSKWRFLALPIYDNDAWRRVKDDPFVKSVAVRVSEDRGPYGMVSGLGIREHMDNVGIITHEYRAAPRGRPMDIGAAVERLEELSESPDIESIVLELKNGQRVVVGDTKVAQVVEVRRLKDGRYPEAGSLFEEIRNAAQDLRSSIESAVGRHLEAIESKSA